MQDWWHKSNSKLATHIHNKGIFSQTLLAREADDQGGGRSGPGTLKIRFVTRDHAPHPYHTPHQKPLQISANNSKSGNKSHQIVQLWFGLVGACWCFVGLIFFFLLDPAVRYQRVCYSSMKLVCVSNYSSH